MVDDQISGILDKLGSKMIEKVNKFKKELTSLRTGRANPQLLDSVYVDYYGARTPLKQIAAISIPQARTLEVKAFDPSAVDGIEAELRKIDLGTSPVKDGSIIRINLPSMNQEQREKMIKIVRKMGEDSRIAVRNERRTAIEILKKAQKRGEISEDDLSRYEQDIQKITDKHITGISDVTAAKEKELQTV